MKREILSLCVAAFLMVSFACGFPLSDQSSDVGRVYTVDFDEAEPQLLDNTTGAYVTIGINLTTIPYFCDISVYDYCKYIYPNSGDKFLLCYTKIENRGYNLTPSRIDGIWQGDDWEQRTHGFDGLVLSWPLLILRIDGDTYGPESFSLKRLMNLGALPGIPRSTDGYYYLKNGQYACRISVFCVPENSTKIEVVEPSNDLLHAGISVRKPYDKINLPIEMAHEIRELRLHTPKQECAKT